MALRPSDVIVGRDRELATAREALANVRRGAATMLVIEGEAGIGKSQLVSRVADEALSRGVSVVSGSAHPFERNRPFGVVAEALDLRPRSADPRRAAIGRLLVGDPAAAATASLADARFRVVEAILELIDAACADAPLVMVLEDLHWADESSLGAIRAIGSELTHVPLLLTATLRPAPRSAELDLLLDDCASAGAEVLHLHPLAPSEVERLVTSSLGAPAGPTLSSIVERAGGNPLWIVEVLRSLSAEGWLRSGPDSVEAAADELPSTLRDLVLRRLRYLPSGTLDVLQLAAVMGESMSIHDLAAVAGRQPREVIADLAEAFRARLLDERDDAVVFRHQLVQQAIYEHVPIAVRRALHRDAAGAFARAGTDLAKVASHLLRGAERGDLEAVRWLRRAAAEAAAGSPSAAVQLFRRAGELLPRSHNDADVVSAELAAALMRAGQVAEATEIAETVLGRPHRDDVDVTLKLTLVDALSLQDRSIELLGRVEAALATPSLQPADRALVMTQASYGQSFSGDFVSGEATARRALQLAEAAASTPMTVWSLCAGSVPVKTQGRYGEALSMTRRAVALAFEPVEHEARLRHPHFFLGMALADSDQFDEARLAYYRAIDDAEEFGTGWLLPDMLAQAGELRFLVGEWDDALTELDAAVHLAEQHGQRITIPQSRAYQSLIAMARGDIAAAAGRLVGLGAALSDGGAPYGAQMVAFAAATIAEADGDATGAFDLLLSAWKYDAERGIRYYHRYLAPALVRLAIGVGRTDVATDVVATVETGAALAPEVPTVQSAARRCRGLLDGDPGVMVEAVELGRRGQRLLDHASTCEDAAYVLMAAGHTEPAKDLLTEAHTQYERVEAAAWASRIASALRGLGVRSGARGTRRRPKHGWASLTPGERAVAELVAEGLTNRQVARRLHVSPHTINTHLRHVFQKLRVSTRAELAAKAPRTKQITHSSDVSAEAERAPSP